MTTTSDTTVAPQELGSPEREGGRLAEGWFLVDVRTPAEFGESSIPGSTNLPLGDLKRWAPELERAAGGRRVALVCRTGRRAEEARKRLEPGGLPLHVLTGGVVAWEARGLPLERGTGQRAMSIERQVRIAAGSLTVLGVALGFLVHPGFFGLAGFVGAGLVFAGVTDTCGMAMVLAKMPWNRAATCATDTQPG